jgi:hypothetical protein
MDNSNPKNEFTEAEPEPVAVPALAHKAAAGCPMV